MHSCKLYRVIWNAAVFVFAITMISMAANAQIAAKTANAVAPAKTFRDCSDCPEMVSISAGSFEMGSTVEERIREGVAPRFFDREGPVHRVTIAKPFAMSRNEITRGMFAQFVAETLRADPPKGCGVFDPVKDNWHERPPFSWRNTNFYQSDDHPVACLSWRDASEFASWLAKKTGKPYRLASEAEWEYAARAGTTTARYWGDAAEPVCKLANTMSAETVARLGSPKSWMDALVCSTTSRSFTQPVGSFPPNPWGLNDMIGNVYEYIADCYHPNYDGAPTDGSAWTEPNCPEHMLRGGAFYSTTWLARSAHRGGPVTADAHPTAAGIRVVRDMP